MEVGDGNGFSMLMAFVDALPVLLFGASCLLIATVFKSVLFFVGAGTCLVAGIGKVAWKVVMAAAHTDVHWLNTQFRYLLPIGFLTMLMAILLNHKSIAVGEMVHNIVTGPAVFFFVFGVAGVLLMAVLAWKMDGSARSNWVEQILNTGAQLCIFLGILFGVMK